MLIFLEWIVLAPEPQGGPDDVANGGNKRKNGRGGEN